MDRNYLTNFPKNFLWGSATSAHQVEGGNRNDWTEWERENSARLAKEALNGKYPDYILNDYPGPLRRENYVSGIACDHYNRFREDFDIAKSLGHNAHRFSIEWSRIEPKEGKFSEEAIEHYRQVIRALRERGIEPFVTLWHWTNPTWVRDIGGWENKKTITYFLKYADKIVSALKNDVKFWITLNEPEIYSLNSYIRGVWPPQKKSVVAYFRVLRNLIKAHKQAFAQIKKIDAASQIGISKNNVYFDAASVIDFIPKKMSDWWWNFYFLNQIKNFQDFIGLNHYFHNRIKNFRFNQNENKKTSDVGWELYPEAIYYVLKDLKHFDKPIYITENGLADSMDEKRGWFILESLKNVGRAIDEDIDVRGYLYWSFLDNFEWDKGFWPRFGLLEIDYKTMERKIRPSAKFYRDICSANGIIKNVVNNHIKFPN